MLDYNDETTFRLLIKACKSKSEAIRKSGKNAKSGNFLTLNKYINKYNVDISHFEYPLKGKPRPNILIDLKLILVENSNYDRGCLKERLYKTGLKQRECEICGQEEEWKGRKMSMILDHINGVNNDNRIFNLRIVCPNCNATLDTHCGKHIKKETKLNNEVYKKRIKKVLELGLDVNIKHDFRKKGIISDDRNLCNINKRKVKDRPSVEQLLQEVKDNGYCATGRKYGVSDNAIRKWIKPNKNPSL